MKKRAQSIDLQKFWSNRLTTKPGNFFLVPHLDLLRKNSRREQYNDEKNDDNEDDPAVFGLRFF